MGGGLHEQRCRGLKSRCLVLFEAGTSCIRGHRGRRAAPCCVLVVMVLDLVGSAA